MIRTLARTTLGALACVAIYLAWNDSQYALHAAVSDRRRVRSLEDSRVDHNRLIGSLSARLTALEGRKAKK